MRLSLRTILASLLLRPAVLLLAAALPILSLAASAESAQAQSSVERVKPGDGARKKLSDRRKDKNKSAARSGDADRGAPKEKDADAAKKSQGAKGARPLFAVVSLGDQRISIYNHNGLVTRSVVSTGMAGHRTPTGIFTIIGRERYHHSNIYSGAPMPFMQRVTWSGVAMHLGVVPGYPASHGCIRLPSRFAAELWGLTKIGERVVIAPRDTAPFEISHPLLPAPKMQPDPMATAEAHPSPDVVRVATAAEMSPGDAPIPTPSKLLNPIAFAAASKAKAIADAADATKALKSTFQAASSKAAEARRTVTERKAAEDAVKAATENAQAAARSIVEALPYRRAAAETAKSEADAEVAIAERRLGEARAREAQAAALSFEAVRAWKEAGAAEAAARTEIKAAARRASPVSVLVSKKDKRVYVRQALAPLLEAPAAISDPERPLGTHVYIASAVGQDDASLKWTAITMPVSRASEDKAVSKRKETPRDGKSKQTDGALRPTASSAAEALERISIPQDLKDQIAELLWIGGSLIITDQPLSGETSDNGTDLVVTMR